MTIQVESDIEPGFRCEHKLKKAVTECASNRVLCNGLDGFVWCSMWGSKDWPIHLFGALAEELTTSCFTSKHWPVAILSRLVPIPKMFFFFFLQDFHLREDRRTAGSGHARARLERASDQSTRTLSIMAVFFFPQGPTFKHIKINPNYINPIDSGYHFFRGEPLQTLGPFVFAHLCSTPRFVSRFSCPCCWSWKFPSRWSRFAGPFPQRICKNHGSLLQRISRGD